MVNPIAIIPTLPPDGDPYGPVELALVKMSTAGLFIVPATTMIVNRLYTMKVMARLILFL